MGEGFEAKGEGAVQTRLHQEALFGPKPDRRIRQRLKELLTQPGGEVIGPHAPKAEREFPQVAGKPGEACGR